MAMDGGTINAEVVCEPEGQGRIQSKMTGHYAPGTYDTAMDMQTTAIQGGMSMHMKARTSGKWISAECPADMANERCSQYTRSEERRVGKEGVSTCRSRRGRYA